MQPLEIRRLHREKNKERRRNLGCGLELKVPLDTLLKVLYFAVREIQSLEVTKINELAKRFVLFVNSLTAKSY